MTIKLGSPAVLLTDCPEPESGPALASGSRVSVVALDADTATVRSRDGGTVTRVPTSALKVTRGRPSRVR
jgi:hypothetical protein